MRECLPDRTITKDEIRGVIWLCDSNKSPGPNEFSFGFVKENWTTLKGDLIKMVKEFR